MSSRKDKRTGKWFYRKQITVRGVVHKLYDSDFEKKSDSDQAERDAIANIQYGLPVASGHLALRAPVGEDARPGWVYFVLAASTIKVGFTSKQTVEYRVKHLQSANHEELRIVGRFFGCEDDERAIHRRFQHLHVRGEWFRAERDLLEYINQAGGSL